MRPLRALVVDDEPLARRKLLSLLRDVPGVEVAGECANGQEAIARLQAEDVDLVFLDVQMPEVSGLDVVEAIGPERMPPVVFVTAYDRYAVRAFEVNALDYLLKPFARARFLATLERARQRLDARAARAGDERLSEVLQQLQRGRGALQRITVQEEGRVFLLDVQEIAWMESEGNYLRLHAGARSYRVRGTIKAIEPRLDPSAFIRISRSVIVSLSHVREMQPWFRGELVLVLHDGTRLTTSAGYAPRLREAIRNPF